MAAVVDAHNWRRDKYGDGRNKPAKNKVFHKRNLSQFTIRFDCGQKALANLPMRVKRIEDINTNQSVPKKSKIVQSKNLAPPEAGASSPAVESTKAPRARRAATNRKRPGSRDKKIAAPQKEKISMPPEAGEPTEPLDDQIRLRAYFISERRRRFALPGDAESDWLEAKRQLLSESGPR